MTFALSAGTITQTGVDTNLSGLSGLAGVTVTDFSSINIGGYKLYVFSGNTKLIVNGTLSFNANIERIIFDANVTAIALSVSSTGSLTVDGSQNFNSLAVGFQYFAISFLQYGSFKSTKGVSSLSVDGTLVLTRAAIYSNYEIWFETTSTITITDGAILSSRNSDLIHIRNFCSNLTINGCLFSNFLLVFFRNPISLANLRWRGSKAAIQTVSTVYSLGTSNQFVFTGLSVSGTVYDLDNYGRGNLLIRNPASKTRYKIVHNNYIEAGGVYKGFTQVTCQVALKIKRSDTGAYLTSGSCFVRDTNNSNRADGTYYAGATVNFVNDRTYFSNASASGVFAQTEILCYVIRGGSDADLTTMNYDFRSIANDESNQFNFIFAAYGYLPTVQNLALSGDALGNAFAGDIAVSFDSRISQLNPVTVAGYTTQSASRFEDVYDYSALEKTLSTAIELPTPSTRVFNSADGKNGVINYSFNIDSVATGISIDHTNAILKIAALSVVSSKYTSVALASGRNITLVQAGIYSQVSFNLLATNLVTVAPGNTDLRGWIFAVGSTINVSSGTAIVTVDAAQSPNITAGTGVTLQTPQATIRFYGMPTVSNTILFVQDLTTNAIIYPTIANGEAIVTVNAARNYKIRADAPGYLASSFVTISGASVDYQFGLTDYRSLYLSGVNRSSQITFNPTTYLITISDATPALSFADVFVTIEDYLATPQGLAYTAHPYPVVLPDRNILQFPYDTTANAINPARIKPAATNTTDPALLFETYLERAADPSYGLFDFSTSNGRIIRIRSVVAIAQVASATIAPSQQQIRDALTIPASSTVAAGSIDSKLALIPITDASIPIAAIKVQTDKFVFTTAGRVDATAIGVPTNPLITTDSRLSNLDAAVSSRASQAALNAIPINPLLTTDTRLSNLDALVSSRASQTALNAIPTNPLVTTDSRLSNLDALVSSRASQITLNAIPTNPVLISDSRLSNLDALVSSRATQVSINALPTLTAIEGSIVLFKSSNYTAPDNAGIGSLNSKLTSARANGFDSLSNLDALITSRATPDQVWAVSYLSLTQVGTIGRMLYWIGKMFGATSTPVTASNTARTTGDGTINQTITTNPDGSKTMSGNP